MLTRIKNIFQYAGLIGFLIGIALTAIAWINNKEFGLSNEVLVIGSYSFGLVAIFSVFINTQSTVKKQDLNAEDLNANADSKEDGIDYSSISHKMETVYLSTESNKNKSDKMLRILCNGLNASQGALYKYLDHDTKVRLQLHSSYAFLPNQLEEDYIFDADTDLVGLAVREDRKIELNDIPRENFKVFSGLGKTSNPSIIIIPVKNDEEVKGAIELSFFGKQDKGIQRFIHDNMSKIGSLL